MAAMLLTEIDHVAIAVRDLEAAIDYYQRAFGATVDHREVVESDGVEEALLKVAESYIQLLTPTRDDSPVAKAIEKRGEGLPSTRPPALARGVPPWPSCTPRAASARSSSSSRSSRELPARRGSCRALVPAAGRTEPGRWVRAGGTGQRCQ